MASIGRYLVESHLREGRRVSELARVHGLHRSWLYKLLARYRAQGEAGLEPRSRRPRSCPHQIAPKLVARILALRRELAEHGHDAGAETIAAHLRRRLKRAPSVSTIWRVLRRSGVVVPQPHKRPRSSLRRFAAALPNEMWQMDATHWLLADGTPVEIVNLIDDHARLALASSAFVTVKAADVVGVFFSAASAFGLPTALLSDNAAVFSGGSRGGTVLLESELVRLGVRVVHARAYHPQTCGKVERFHQTQKKFLAKQPPASSLAHLQAQLDAFRTSYNQRRPHRALGGKTPLQAWHARIKASPPAARARDELPRAARQSRSVWPGDDPLPERAATHLHRPGAQR